MIKINQTPYNYEITCGNQKIVIPTEMYQAFQENLFVSYGKNIEKQITPEELTFVDFNLLFQHHAPHYADDKMRRLNMELLKEVCKWTSETIYVNKKI
jgi:hypothetical protein